MRKNILTKINIYVVRDNLFPLRYEKLFITDCPINQIIKRVGEYNHTMFGFEIKKTKVRKIDNAHYKIVYITHHLFAEEYGRDSSIPQLFEYDLFIQNS